MSKSFSFFVVALLAGLVICTGPVAAQKFLESYKKPMPKLEMAPQADFEKATTVFTETPFGDKALAFDMRVPKDWQKQRDVSASDAALGGKLLGELVRFYGPPKLDNRSYITVQALSLDYKLTAEQWLLQYLLTNSYTVQGFKAHDDTQAEALFIVLEKDVTYIVRMAIRINGKRVLMAQYYLPTQYWEEEKVAQAQTISTFKILNRNDEFVEAMTRYQFLDVAEFMYPASWEMRSEPLKSIDRLKTGLISVASEEEVKQKKIKSLNGKIDVLLSSVYVAENLEAELKRVRGDLERSGLIVQSLIEIHNDFHFESSFESVPVEVYTLIDRDDTMISYELWSSILQTGDYYYFVYLITPSRDQDFFIWSRNTQTFRVVMSTFKPQEGSLLEED